MAGTRGKRALQLLLLLVLVCDFSTAVLQIEEMDCLGDANNAKSVQDLCGPNANLTFIDNFMFGESSDNKATITLYLSSKGPDLSKQELEQTTSGTQTVISLATKQYTVKDIKDSHMTVALPTGQFTFPQMCGHYMVVAVLAVTTTKATHYSSTAASVEVPCDTEDTDLILMMEDENFDPDLKLTPSGFEGRLPTIKVKNVGSKAFPSMTLLDAPEVLVAITGEEAVYEILMNDSLRNMTWDEISAECKSIYSQFLDNLPWSTTKLTGLETLLTSNDEQGLAINPGEEKEVDLSVVSCPPTYRKSGLVYLAVVLNTLDDYLPHWESHRVIMIPVNVACGYESMYDEPRSCEVIPGSEDQGSSAIFFTKHAYPWSRKQFMYDGTDRTIRSLPTSSPALESWAQGHLQALERSQRMMKLGLCSEPPVDDLGMDDEDTDIFVKVNQFVQKVSQEVASLQLPNPEAQEDNRRTLLVVQAFEQLSKELDNEKSFLRALFLSFSGFVGHCLHVLKTKLLHEDMDGHDVMHSHHKFSYNMHDMDMGGSMNTMSGPGGNMYGPGNNMFGSGNNMFGQGTGMYYPQTGMSGEGNNMFGQGTGIFGSGDGKFSSPSSSNSLSHSGSYFSGESTGQSGFNGDMYEGMNGMFNSRPDMSTNYDGMNGLKNTFGSGSIMPGSGGWNHDSGGYYSGMGTPNQYTQRGEEPGPYDYGQDRKSNHSGENENDSGEENSYFGLNAAGSSNGDCAFKCGDGTCLEEENDVCDGEDDCPDGSDEKYCTALRGKRNAEASLNSKTKENTFSKDFAVKGSKPTLKPGVNKTKTGSMTGGSGKPGSSQSGQSTSRSSQPGQSTSGSSQPGQSTSVSSQLGQSTSGSSQPGQSTSGSSQPGQSTSGSSQPGQSTSGSSQPGQSTSGSSQPGQSTSGSSKGKPSGIGKSNYLSGNSVPGTNNFSMTGGKGGFNSFSNGSGNFPFQVGGIFNMTHNNLSAMSVSGLVNGSLSGIFLPAFNISLFGNGSIGSVGSGGWNITEESSGRMKQGQSFSGPVFIASNGSVSGIFLPGFKLNGPGKNSSEAGSENSRPFGAGSGSGTGADSSRSSFFISPQETALQNESVRGMFIPISGFNISTMGNLNTSSYSFGAWNLSMLPAFGINNSHGAPVFGMGNGSLPGLFIPAKNANGSVTGSTGNNMFTNWTQLFSRYNGTMNNSKPNISGFDMSKRPIPNVLLPSNSKTSSGRGSGGKSGRTMPSMHSDAGVILNAFDLAKNGNFSFGPWNVSFGSGFRMPRNMSFLNPIFGIFNGSVPGLFIPGFNASVLSNGSAWNMDLGKWNISNSTTFPVPKNYSFGLKTGNASFHGVVIPGFNISLFGNDSISNIRIGTLNVSVVNPFGKQKNKTLSGFSFKLPNTSIPSSFIPRFNKTKFRFGSVQPLTGNTLGVVLNSSFGEHFSAYGNGTSSGFMPLAYGNASSSGFMPSGGYFSSYGNGSSSGFMPFSGPASTYGNASSSGFMPSGGYFSSYGNGSSPGFMPFSGPASTYGNASSSGFMPSGGYFSSYGNGSSSGFMPFSGPASTYGNASSSGFMPSGGSFSSYGNGSTLGFMPFGLPASPYGNGSSSGFMPFSGSVSAYGNGSKSGFMPSGGTFSSYGNGSTSGFMPFGLPASIYGNSSSPGFMFQPDISFPSNIATSVLHATGGQWSLQNGPIFALANGSIPGVFLPILNISNTSHYVPTQNISFGYGGKSESYEGFGLSGGPFQPGESSGRDSFKPGEGSSWNNNFSSQGNYQNMQWSGGEGQNWNYGLKPHENMRHGGSQYGSHIEGQEGEHKNTGQEGNQPWNRFGQPESGSQMWNKFPQFDEKNHKHHDRGRHNHWSSKHRSPLSFLDRGDRKRLTDLLSKFHLRLMLSEPEEMNEFSFIPLDLRKTLKKLMQKVPKDSTFPAFLQPWKLACRNNVINQSTYENFTSDLDDIMSSGKNFSAMFTDIVNITNYYLVDVVRSYVKGNETLTALLDLSLRYIGIIDKHKDSLGEIVDFVRITSVFDDEENKCLEGKPGREPTNEEYCYSASQRWLEGSGALQPEDEEEESGPIFNVLDEMLKATATHHKPVYWSSDSSGIYRGQRSSLFGNMFWKKVAVCNCGNKMGFNLGYDKTSRIATKLNGTEATDMTIRQTQSEHMGLSVNRRNMTSEANGQMGFFRNKPTNVTSRENRPMGFPMNKSRNMTSAESGQMGSSMNKPNITSGENEQTGLPMNKPKNMTLKQTGQMGLSMNRPKSTTSGNQRNPRYSLGK